MMISKKLRGETVFGIGALAGIAAIRVLRQTRYEVAGKTVFISGGSRGLGLLLAHEFASRGARIAISGRDREFLDRAAASLRRDGAEVLALETDISMREEAELAVDQIRRKFGAIDVLVNNAGTICVGPMEVMTIDDYRNSLNTHFWGPYFATMAVLPEMQRRRHGRIVNISSIGGKISVPHLLPYCVGKFALTGFSEGLRSAALKDNIFVTTVCPGLMRTGSPQNAFFKGNNKAEYAWFSISDALPLLSMDARRAARQIVNASLRGKAEVVLSLPAKFAVEIHGLFPGTTSDILGLVNQLLPSAKGDGTEREPKTGKQSFSEVSPSWVTTLNERAAAENNQIP
jgi:NAD(P)-dependent dehydrogenase (short-subunit alcohol dehydrogenase family)